MPDVNKRIFKSKWTKYLAEFAVLLLGLMVLLKGCALAGEPSGTRHVFLQGILSGAWEELGGALADEYMPAASLCTANGHETYWLLQRQLDSLFPAYGYLTEGLGEEQDPGQEASLLAGIGAGDVQEYAVQNEASYLDEAMLILEEQLREEAGDGSLAELLRAENDAAQHMLEQASALPFTAHEKQTQVDLEPLSRYETLVQQFYTIDASTMAGREQLNVDKFLSQDMTVKKGGEGYQILIYHTHSQEAFADSVKGERAHTIMGMGDYLTQILTDTYGYKVLHHDGQYDVKSRDDAYSAALPELERILKENPSIEVVIDLHRDAMPEGTRLVTELDGKPTARFMFFNGLSRTKNTGNISYLYNENLDANLAFSFQMQLKAMEYYPGLTRRIYLKGYRYNMHLRPKSLLIELGAQNNTVEEAMNACAPLAHILDLVLSGQ